MRRVNELLAERNLSLYRLAQMSGISYSTLKNTAQRNGQLSVDTIERICDGLQIPLSEFFVKRS
jgi:transcriptional regulator with XRE-family HTH domain